MLYPVLHWMERKRFIESEWRDSESGRRRKYYTPNKDGRKAAVGTTTVDDGPHNLDEIMEDQTSFSLSQEIQHWRDNLGQSSAIGGDSLDELESHLRDSTAALRSSGLSLEESFLIATRRIDGHGRLTGEFRKINSKPVWMRKASFVVVAIVFLVAGAGITGSIVRWDSPQWLASLLSKPSQDAKTVHTWPMVVMITHDGGVERMRAQTSRLIFLDERTGEIVAMIGGRDYGATTTLKMEGWMQKILRGSSIKGKDRR